MLLWRSLSFNTRFYLAALLGVVILAVVLVAPSAFQPASGRCFQGQKLLGGVSGEVELIVVPVRDIFVGNKVGEEAFAEAYWPCQQVPDGAIRTMSELNGYKDWYAGAHLLPSYPFTRDKLVPQFVQTPVAVSRGHQAVCVEVSGPGESPLAPNTPVDVYLTQYDKLVGRVTYKIIVHNAHALCWVDDFQKTGQCQTCSPDPRDYHAIALDVSAEDAQILEQSRKLGRITLAAPEASTSLTPGPFNMLASEPK